MTAIEIAYCIIAGVVAVFLFVCTVDGLSWRNLSVRQKVGFGVLALFVAPFFLKLFTSGVVWAIAS